MSLEVEAESKNESSTQKTSPDNTTVCDKTNINRKKKSRFFETYIHRVIKQVSSNHGITSNSKQQINSALCIISRTISLFASRLTEIADKKTVSDKEVANAVRVLFTGDLLNSCIEYGNKSVINFSKFPLTRSSRHNKAGIVFPPSLAEKFLRNFGYSNVMVTSTAPVFLAAVIEQVACEILVISTEYCNNNKRIRITIRDLHLAVGEDSELSTLFNKLNISFLGGGSIPYIHPCLLVKKPRKKKKNIDSTCDKKPHRFRPGTVALREIKRLQKMSDCLTFARLPFERLVRYVVQKNKPDMKISKNVLVILQYFIEQYVVDILKDANSAAIHAGRVKLMLVDIEFISSIRGISTKGFPDKLEESVIDKLDE
jgi:histone H3